MKEGTPRKRERESFPLLAAFFFSRPGPFFIIIITLAGKRTRGEERKEGREEEKKCEEEEGEIFHVSLESQPCKREGEQEGKARKRRGVGRKKKKWRRRGVRSFGESAAVQHSTRTQTRAEA